MNKQKTHARVIAEKLKSGENYEDRLNILEKDLLSFLKSDDEYSAMFIDGSVLLINDKTKVIHAFDSVNVLKCIRLHYTGK